MIKNKILRHLLGDLSRRKRDRRRGPLGYRRNRGFQSGAGCKHRGGSSRSDVVYAVPKITIVDVSSVFIPTTSMKK